MTKNMVATWALKPIGYSYIDKVNEVDNMDVSISTSND